MKKIFTIMLTVLLTVTLWAQSPEKMSYQAVIRNASNNLVTSQSVGMQISILQGFASGTAVYVETQTPTTNANGLVNIEIGNGTVVSGDFTTINWANGPYFIKTETDPTGGTNYSITGTSQLLSVPYALHTKTAETVTGGITESDPIFKNSEAANITAIDITNLGNLSGTNTGDQDLGALATKTALGDSTAQIRSEIPDVSGFLTSESDPVYSSSVAGSITQEDTIAWNNKVDNETQTIADVIAINNSANGRIKNLANPLDNQDAVTKYYVDSILETLHTLIVLETEHLLLWNKLGSVQEVQNSAIGPDGTIIDSVHFNNDVKFGKGITPKTGNGNSGVDFPTTIVDPEKGCVEMWVEFYYEPQAYNYGAYGFINVAHWSSDIMSFFWYNDGRLSFNIKFNGTKRKVELNDYNPSLNTPVHLACVWDKNGINGSGDYMRIYVNGSLVASNNIDNDWGTDNTSGIFRIAAPWDSDYLNEDRYSVDQIKLWDFAKTNF